MIPTNEQPYPLPEGWQWCRLGDVTKNQYGYTAKALKNDSLPKILRITDIQDGAVNWHEVPNCEIDDEQKKKYLLQDNDIVIARTGATTGKSYIVSNPINSVFASYLIRLQLSKPINVRYLYYFLQSDLYWQQISELSAGIAQPGVNSSKLKRMPFPLPPIDEQQRIVALLDELFSKLDEAKALAQAVVDGSELRRTAILHKAFTGELSKLWRNEHGTTLDSWQLCLLSELLLPMQTKRPTGKTFRYIDIDSIDNKIQAVREPKTIETADAPSRASRSVESGNVLFSMVRPYLKNVALIDESLSNCIASTGFFVCRCKTDLIPKFLYQFLCFDGTISYLTQFMKGDNSPAIRRNEFLGTSINLPPLEEQKEIVRLLDDLLGREQRTKDIALQTIEHLETMKKSILARAFRGKLSTK